MLKAPHSIEPDFIWRRKMTFGSLFFIRHVMLPLLTGLGTYLFLRSEITIAEEAFNWHFIPNYTIETIPVLNVLAGSFPDFCWLYALLNCQALIWGHRFKMPAAIIAVIYIVPILTELFQGMGVIPGTGDWFDVIAYILAIVIYSKLHTHKKEHAYENNN